MLVDTMSSVVHTPLTSYTNTIQQGIASCHNTHAGGQHCIVYTTPTYQPAPSSSSTSAPLSRSSMSAALSVRPLVSSLAALSFALNADSISTVWYRGRGGGGEGRGGGGEGRGGGGEGRGRGRGRWEDITHAQPCILPVCPRFYLESVSFPFQHPTYTP